MSTGLLEELDKYFAETPREQVLKDWEDCQEEDKGGMMTMIELLDILDYSDQVQNNQVEKIPIISEANNVLITPNLKYDASGFFNSNMY